MRRGPRIWRHRQRLVIRPHRRPLARRSRSATSRHRRPELVDLLKYKADRLAQQVGVPPDPAGYQIKLKDGFALPDGVKVEFDETDPAIADLRSFAHAKGWSQDDLSDVLGIHAQREIAQQQAFKNAVTAEQVKLGANGTARITAITTWLRAELADDELLKPMLATLVTERQVRAWEKIAGKKVTQGEAPFSQAHRAVETERPGRLSAEDYGKLSPGEKLNYARQFPQPKAS